VIPLLLACSGGEPTTAERAEHLTLVYSANVDGEIEPCG